MKKQNSYLKSIFIQILLGLPSLYALENQPISEPDFKGVMLQTPPYSFVSSFQGLALIPSTNNLNYAILAKPAVYGFHYTNYSPNWHVYQITPSFNFGFLAEIAGVFEESSSKLSLGWERVHTTTASLTKDIDSSDSMIGPYFESGGFMRLFSSTLGKTYYHFDEIHLDAELLTRFGKKTQINFLAGISYLRLLQSLKQVFDNHFARQKNFFNSQQPLQRSISCPTKFLGMGPEFGFDFSYQFLKRIHLVGLGKTAFYLGNFFNKTKLFTESENLRNLKIDKGNQQTITTEHFLGVVPGFLGKLGFSADFQAKNGFKLIFEAGFQAQIYLNSIRSVNIAVEYNDPQDSIELGSTKSDTSTGFYPNAFQRLSSDFSLAGPYGKIDIAF